VLYADSFYNLSKLHTLDLSNNSIATVPSSLLALSSSWKVLDLSHNQLTTVPSGVKDIVAEGYM
jgi:Leucine-rich repeat (LRR) protein